MSWLFLFFMSFQAQAGMHELYAANVAKDTEAVLQFAKSPSTKDCDEAPNKGAVTCFKLKIKSFELGSSSQVYPLIRAGLSAAEKDAKDRRYDLNTKNLVTSDAILTVMEQIKPTKFHVNNLRPLGTLAEMELKQIKKDEEKTLQVLINQQVVDIVQKKLKDVEKAHADVKKPIPENLKKWQSSVLADLKLRMERMRVMKFLLP